MSVFDSLLKEVLPNLESGLSSSLLKDLESAGEGIAVKNVAASLGHIILKAVDGVVVEAVKHLSADEASKLANSYLTEVDGEIVKIGDVLMQYIPLQVDVVSAKRQFGNNSTEANDAREKRAVGIKGFKDAVSEAFATLIDKHTTTQTS